MHGVLECFSIYAGTEHVCSITDVKKNWVRVRNLLVMSFSLFVLLYIFWLYVVLELIREISGYLVTFIFH